MTTLALVLVVLLLVVLVLDWLKPVPHLLDVAFVFVLVVILLGLVA